MRSSVIEVFATVMALEGYWMVFGLSPRSSLADNNELMLSQHTRPVLIAAQEMRRASDWRFFGA